MKALRLRRTVCFVLGLAVLGGVFGAGDALASAECKYHRATKVVTARITDEVDATIVRAGTGIRLVSGNYTYACGRATVRNTNRIDITGLGGSFDTAPQNIVTIDEQKGRFAPGARHEAAGRSEIEIRVSITPGNNPFVAGAKVPLILTYLGTARADVVRAGQSGIDLNGDGDVDLRNVLTPFDSYALYGFGGADVLSGAGSRAAGLAVGVQVSLTGNGDNDRLWGGGRADTLAGGSGADKINGFSGVDELFGGGGNDTLGAVDNGPDTVDGGNGTDSAVVDPEDTVTNVESVVSES